MILFLVLQSGKPGLKVFVTEGAFKRPVLGVQDHVLLEMRPAAEGLKTNLLQKNLNVWTVNFLKNEKFTS